MNKRQSPGPPISAPTAYGLPPTVLRRGITLIELLITMVIIAIISAAIMGTATAAMENARRSRTRVMVTRIHQLLLEQYESYAERRIPVKGQLVLAVNTGFQVGNPPDFAQTNKRRGQVMADIRLIALRELMKFEMPDRWSDIEEDIVFLDGKPTVAQTCLRKLQQIRLAGADPKDIALNQGAECLYLTVMYNTGDGEARTLFSEKDIGDADGDGAFEFLDGWGRPIAWIRWPAGFVVRSQLMTGNAQADHDPLDPYRRDDPASVAPLSNEYPTNPVNLPPFIARLRDANPAFRLLPLVYSSGPDGMSDVNTAGGLSVADANDIAFDPYALDKPTQPHNFDTNPFRIGVPEDNADERDGEDNSIDNIHSHLTDY